MKKLHLVELEILKKFDALCKKNNISYIIFWGAAIGAVRHSGFVPWDDDIDVLLLRKDFEKFLKIAKEECAEDYYLLTAEENINYPLMTAHWGPKDTCFVSSSFKNVPCHFTISLDIFPLDTVSDNKVQSWKQCFAAWFWQKLMLLRSLPHPISQYCGLKRKVFYTACSIVHFILRFLHISPKYLYMKCKEACLLYEDTSTGKVGFLTDTYPTQNIFLMDDLFPQRCLKFEDTIFPFPNNVESMLTEYYGDYMQLPPEEKRIKPFPYLLDFGDGERYENYD